MTRIDCISINFPLDWNKALEGIKHSYAHTWEYNYAMQLTTGFPTYLFKYEKNGIRIVCPIAERKFLSYTDILTPFGISGFVGNGPCEEFPSTWKKYAQDRGYICGYIVVNPFFFQSSYVNQGDLFDYNILFRLDLQLSEKELFSNLSTNRKRQIRKFEKALEDFCLDKLTLIDFFISNYYDFLSRKNAPASYQLSKETLSFLLNQDNCFLAGIREGGLVTAVSVFVYTMHMGDYLFNISIPGAEKHSVPLIWYGLKKVKSMGVPFLNLGGSNLRGDNDNLAEFKRRFGPEVYPLRVLKQVYDHEIYQDLCFKVGAEPGDKSGYFPPYHAT